jgi:xanthine/CO dehydrogenase XdhC/CoxF family maturation factor
MSLKERRDIVALHRAAGAAGGGGVLMSLVGVEGSSYRRPGARLLVSSDGRTAGTLSGGCLEADLLRRAAWSVRGGAVVEHFSTAFDHTAEIPYGLGCGGEVDLLLEPAGTPEADALLEAVSATLRGELRVVVSCLPGTDGLTRMVMDERGDVLFASDALPTEEIVDLRVAARRAAHGSRVRVGSYDMFVERLDAAQRVVIFGAGEDAQPVVRFAAEMGWSVVVADGRSQFAKAERFPAAEAVVMAASVADAGVMVDDAVVLMTHSYEQDRRLLAELLLLAPRYLGLLGARHRSALLLQEAAEIAGMPLTLAVERTCAPIGLEVGGDGPEAVALAIVAELQRVLTGARAAGHRRMSVADAERILAEGIEPLRAVVRAGEGCSL